MSRNWKSLGRAPMQASYIVERYPGDGVPLLEVWIIDTGEILVLRDVPTGFLADGRWMRTMRLRRALRLFVPETEISKLPGIRMMFKIAMRGLEIRDAVQRGQNGSAHLTLRGVQALTALFPDEGSLPVRQVPRKLPPVCWISPEEEERRKRAAAGKEPDAPKGLPKPPKRKNA